jgi:NAD-dependent dihydropyrimidine dehydrogenase PreA subunit
MAFVIAEPCIGTKDTACVDACPVDCIHPKKNTTYDDARPDFDEVPQFYIDPIECFHFSGRSSSAKIAETGQTGTQAPQSMHWTICRRSGSSIRNTTRAT